jgi:Lrp/AsnC family transcriptional regulator for asnA, asnC and gidA
MDELDLLIMNELMKDCQTPLLRIARKLGVSPETVRTRYAKLKEDGKISHCSISIDLSKIGYQCKVFLLITNAPKNDKSKTLETLMKMEDIFIVSEIIGDFELIAIAAIKDLNGLKMLVNKIKELPSVSRVEFTLIYDTAFPVTSRFGELFRTQY